jgi:hypothetical protein
MFKSHTAITSKVLKNAWTICANVVFLQMSVGLLNFVTETQQQQGNIIHTTTTLSQARHSLAAASSNELIFFGGGYTSTQIIPQVDIYNATNGSWTTATLSIRRVAPAATFSRNLVFFGGGWNGSTVSDRVDMFTFKKVLYLNGRFLYQTGHTLPLMGI